MDAIYFGIIGIFESALRLPSGTPTFIVPNVRMVGDFRFRDFVDITGDLTEPSVNGRGASQAA